MDEVLKIYQQIHAFSDIKSLIGQDETLILEFKGTASKDGRPTEDDKRNLAKAISGFAHRDGGVIVWGVGTTKIETVDKATSLCPIKNVQKFKTGLEDYSVKATDPTLYGVESRIIFENDNSKGGSGFLVTYIPSSSGEHQSTHKDARGFYKRFEQGQIPLPTSDVKLLFFRNFSPKLVPSGIMDPSDNTCILKMFLENQGRGIGQFFALYIGFTWDSLKSSDLSIGRWYDSEGGGHYSEVKMVNVINQAPFLKKVSAQSGIVIHPGEKLGIAQVFVNKSPSLQSAISFKLHFKLYAKDMIPNDGVLDLDWPR